MKLLRELEGGKPDHAPKGMMPVASYLAGIERLTADDPMITTPIHVPAGWTLPPDAVLGKPLLWIIRHVMGVELWPTQAQIIQAVEENKRVSCRACQAAGKSWASSALMLAYVLAHESVVALSTAPTSRQVTAILWAHIAELHRTSRLPLGGDLLQTQWKLGPDRFALGFTSNSGVGDYAVKFQGFHAQHVLVVVDEASDVMASTFNALKGALTSADSHLLLIGNPTETSGYFYDSHNSLRHLFCTLHIPYTATPNFQGRGEVAPYLITESFVEQATAEWGGVGSPQFDVRCLGNFPSQSSDSIIAVQWAEDAVKRPAPVDTPRRVYEMGVDVARFGSDESAVCIRSGDEVIYTEAWSKFDTMYTADRVAELARKYRVTSIRVDCVGVGAGAFDGLRQLQDVGKLPTACRLVEFNAASKPRDPERFKLRRDETWQALRDRFREGRVACLPNDQKLIGQLTSIRYYHDSANRMQVESKDVLKKRGLHSPDRAEALMLAYTVDRPVGEGQTFDQLLEHATGGTIFGDLMSRQF